MDQRERVDSYLNAYSHGRLETVQTLLSEDVVAEYSNLGRFEGCQAVLDGLHFRQAYDDQTVTVLGRLSYQDGGKTVMALTAQHMNLQADIPVIYPVVYGGKYVFVLDDATGLIEKISFVLEYQGENTFFLAHWKLAGNMRDYSPLAAFDTEKALANISVQAPEARARDTVRLLCWALDTHDFAILHRLVLDNAALCRDKTYSNGTIEGTGAEIESWLTAVEGYYELSQHGYKVADVQKTTTGWVVTAQLLSPHRLNTKKMHNANKYHSFFEEEITLRLDEEMRLTALKAVKLSDIQYNGFDVLEME